MVVCICNVVNKDDLKKIIESHDANTIEDIQQHIDVCDCCMICEEEINDIINNEKTKSP